MSNLNIQKLKEERAQLLDELVTLSQMLHGSWVERYSVCSRPNCKCRQGERHGPRRYLVVNEAGRQRQKYIPNAQVDAVREGIKQHARLKSIVDRITDININLIRLRAYAEN